jgi:ABC-type branched-subunit amino acid transport system ATPase component
LEGIQEEWLDELVEFIDRIEKLEKTTIVITINHEIRTVREDPQLIAVFIVEHSFHVPL